MVDEVLASCYPSADHDLSHIVMTPMRWFPKTIEWIFGEENGLQGFAIIAENLGNWMTPNGQDYKSVM